MNEQPCLSRFPSRDVFRLPELKAEDPYLAHREDSGERIDFDVLARSGFFLYRWNLEWAHKTSGQLVQSVNKLVEELDEAFDKNKTEIDGHPILLMHDQMFPDRLNRKENLSNILKSLKEAGYTLATLDEYPANR